MKARDKLVKFRDNIKETEDGSFTAQLEIEKDELNYEVDDKLVKTIAFLIFAKGNAFVTLKPNKEISMIGMTNCSDMDSKFRTVHKIEFQDVIDMYFKEDIKEDENREIALAGQQSAMFVSIFWLRFGCKEFGFKWDKKNKVVTLGLGIDFQQGDATMIRESVERHKTNPDGIFWKREWVQDKDLDTKKGGAKW